MRESIGIKLGDSWLDLPQDLTIQIEISNALFETERIPGTLTFPFTLPFSSINNRLLGFPGHLSVARYRQPQMACQLYLMGLLWKVGKLNIIKRTAKGYEVNFQTDVGDVSTELKEKSLRELELGTGVLDLGVSGVYPQANHALFPVLNNSFFDGKVGTFEGIVNYFDGTFQVGADRPITPFPFLLYVLEKAAASFGYTLKGEWLEEEETRRLVIYNTYALDLAGLGNGAAITYANHVPDIKVNEFLKAIRTHFALGMVFHPTRKELEIIRLHDVANDRSYVEWTGNTGRVYDWEPTQANGFLLEMTADQEDELQKTATGLSYAVGAGQEVITSQVGTLGMELYLGRLLPAAEQKGGNLDSSGEPGKFSLRLLSYRGLQQKEGTGTYPLGTSGTIDAQGTQIGTDSLEWAGPTGLYERRHKAWLDFLSEAETVHTEQTFRIQDILGLDARRRAFIRHESGVFTGLWEKISLSVSRKKGIQAAKVPLKRIY